MEDQPRIEVQLDGPYVVYGNVPLSEMAPVHTFNGEPVAWHTLRDLPATEGASFELCRCGQSSSKPFCDGSHETNGFDGAETADRRTFAERAEIHRGRGASLAEDGALCFSAGFCGTRTTDAWKLLLEAQDPEQYARMKDMVWHCPSGRLVLQDEAGNAIEPELPQDIAVLPGGPLWVRGGIPITAADGTQWETRNRVALCRCGASKNKPFCDDSHSDLHFDER
jgi:CDGSH-type Zn-finger protein